MNKKQVVRLRKIMKGAKPAEWRAAKKRYSRLSRPKKEEFWKTIEG